MSIVKAKTVQISWTIALLTFTFNLAHRLVDIPLNRLFEENICRTYYTANDPVKVPSDGKVPEELCKEDAIQEQLAYWVGLITTLELIFGIRSLDIMPLRKLTLAQRS